MNDTARMALATAQRLRLIQASLSEEDGPTRSSYLADTVSQGIKAVPASEHAEFLRRLADEFPVPDPGRDEPAPAPTPAEPSAARVLDLALTLAPDERKKLVAQLRERGLVPAEAAPQGAIPEPIQSAANAFMQRVGVPELDVSRVFEIAALLMEFAGGFEQTAWMTWNALAPQSALKKKADLVARIREYLAETGDAPPDQVKQEVERLRKLAAALWAALGHLPQQVARDHFARFSPEEIDGLVGVEGGSLLTSREVRCWRKYVELVGSFNEARIEQDIQAGVAKYVESLMKASGR